MKKVFLLLSFVIFTIYTFAQVSSDSLIAYYPFSGSDFDFSFNSNNDSVYGAKLTTDRFGIPNFAYEFNGSDNWIDCGTSDTLNLTDSFTITGWLNCSGSTGDHQVILAKYNNSSPNGYVIELEPTAKKLQLALGFNGFSLEYYQANDTISFNEWQFFVLTYNGDSVSVFINDSLSNSFLQTGNIYPSHEPLYIGAHNYSGDRNPFNGKIDNIRIFKRVLTESEISALYNANYSMVFDTTHVTVNDTITTEVFDTTYITAYDSVSVTDTLIIDVTIVGIAPPNNENTIKVYPNPTSDIVYINTGNNYPNMTSHKIRIVNNSGQTIFENFIDTQLFSIDVSTFGATGLYFIQIIDETSQIIDIRKIILK
jgi:hypothetical protein